MIVVADTGPINYLLQLNLIDLLPSTYKRVVIPAAVRNELSDPSAPLAVRHWIENPPDWVEVAYGIPLDHTLPGHLGAGEREALTYALSTGIDIALDDQQARIVARRRGLKPTGTLRILTQAAIDYNIDLRETLTQLARLGFYITPALIEEVLTLANSPTP